jgi:Domain of unknown function (DUF4157)
MSTRAQLQMKATPAASQLLLGHGLLQRACACGGAAGLTGECEDCRMQRMVARAPLVQPKLTVSQPGDRYEQEADRVADTVMRMTAPQKDDEDQERLQAKPIAAAITPLVQRQVEPEEDDEDEQPESQVQRQVEPEEDDEQPIQARLAGAGQIQRQEAAPEEVEDEEEIGPVQTKSFDTPIAPLVQRRADVSEADEEETGEETVPALQPKAQPGQVPTVTPDLAGRIQALRGGGRELPAAERTFFEPRFGQDFGGVRVHSDGTAAELTRAIQARAFTVGRDVVFGAGQYAPGSSEGRRLLAHELTHTIQQGKAPAIRTRAIDHTTKSGATTQEAVPDKQSSDLGYSIHVRACTTEGLQRAKVGESEDALGGCGICLLRVLGGKGFAEGGKRAHSAVMKRMRKLTPWLLAEERIKSMRDSDGELDLLISTQKFQTLLSKLTKKAAKSPTTTGSEKIPDIFDPVHERPGATKKAVAIGEIKPDSPWGRDEGEKIMPEYMAKVQEVFGPDTLVVPFKLPLLPGPILFPEPTRPKNCPVQKLYIAHWKMGIHLYRCEPPYRELVSRPECSCKQAKKGGKKEKNKKKEEEQGTKKQPNKKQKKTQPKQPKRPVQASRNFGIGLAINSSFSGGGNAGVGIAINSSGTAYGTAGAGFLYNSHGTMIGGVGAGASIGSTSTLVGAAGAGLTKSSQATAAGAAGAGKAEGVNISGAGLAGAGKAQNVDVTGAGVAGKGTAKDVTGDVSGKETSSTVGGAGAQSPPTPSSPEFKAAQAQARRAEKAIAGATPAQMELIRWLAGHAPDQFKRVPNAAWIEDLLAATKDLSLEQVAQLKQVGWDPAPEHSREQMQQQLRTALSRGSGSTKQGANKPTAAPGEQVKTEPGAGKSTQGAGADTGYQKSVDSIIQRGTDAQRKLFALLKEDFGIAGTEEFARKFIEKTRAVTINDVADIGRRIEKVQPKSLEEILKSLDTVLAAVKDQKRKSPKTTKEPVVSSSEKQRQSKSSTIIGELAKLAREADFSRLRPGKSLLRRRKSTVKPSELPWINLGITSDGERVAALLDIKILARTKDSIKVQVLESTGMVNINEQIIIPAETMIGKTQTFQILSK